MAGKLKWNCRCEALQDDVLDVALPGPSNHKDQLHMNISIFYSEEAKDGRKD